MLYYIFYISLLVVAILLALWWMSLSYESALHEVNVLLRNLSEGNFSGRYYRKYRGGVGHILLSIKRLQRNLSRISNFVQKVGEGDFEAQLQRISEKDELSDALISMRDKLRVAAEEEQKRSWATEGYAQFGEILRANSGDFEILGEAVMIELVKYIEANQGGLYIRTTDKEGREQLELKAFYAYGRKKYIHKSFLVNPLHAHNLIEQAFLEKESIYMNDLPDGYTEITSGLGQATPSNILLVPLKINQEVEGVLEIASFKVLEPHVISFVENIAEDIASSVAMVKINEQTQRLLDESQKQAIALKEKEEEMRQNNLELTKSQGDMQKQQSQLNMLLQHSKQQEANLATLINNTEDLIAIIDKNFNLQLFNQSFGQHYAQPGIVIEKGMNALDLQPRRSQADFRSDFNKAFLGQLFKVERKISFSRQDFKIFEINYSPIRNDKGQIQNVSIFYKDITEYIRKNEKIRRAQQEAIQQTKQLEHIRNSVNRSGIIILEMDMDGYILDANPAFLQALKYDSLNDIIGKQHRDFVPPNVRKNESYKKFWERLKRGESPDGTYERVAKDGSPVWLKASYNVISEVNGKAVMVIKVAYEITDSVVMLDKIRKQAEMLEVANQETQQRLEEINLERSRHTAILEGYVDGVISFDDQSRIHFINQAAEEMFVTERMGYLGKHIQDLIPIEIRLQGDSVRVFVNSLNGELELLVRTRTEVSVKVDGVPEDFLFTLTKSAHGDHYDFTIFVQKISIELF